MSTYLTKNSVILTIVACIEVVQHRPALGWPFLEIHTSDRFLPSDNTMATDSALGTSRGNGPTAPLSLAWCNGNLIVLIPY